jgi:hypothetical protein
MTVERPGGKSRQLVPCVLWIPGHAFGQLDSFHQQWILDCQQQQATVHVFSDEARVPQRLASGIGEVHGTEDGRAFFHCITP